MENTVAGGREREKSLLQQFLDDKDDAFRARVLDIVVKHGIPTDDPLFLIHMELGATQVMCQELPAALEMKVEEARELHGKLAREAIDSHRSTVGATVRDLIAKTESLQLRRPYRVLMPGLALFALVFSLGALAGIAASVSLTQLAGSGRRVTTLEEAALLDWAKSDRGKFARELYRWNGDYIESGNCINDMAGLKVELVRGTRRYRSGFCALWVVPPSGRR
jgi:hypothetical protein